MYEYNGAITRRCLGIRAVNPSVACTLHLQLIVLGPSAVVAVSEFLPISVTMESPKNATPCVSN